MSRTPRLLTSLALAAVALPVAGASASPVSPVTLAAETTPTQVAGYGGYAMWSSKDPATGNYRLMLSTNGGPPTVVPVAERSTPFDVDLGTNRGVSVYAVYTRDGDIYRLNPRTGVETKLTTISSPTAAERDPSMMVGRVAFIRRVNGFDELRLARTTKLDFPTSLLVKAKSIASVEVGLQQVAYVTYKATEFGELDVHIRNFTTRHDETVYRARSGGANMASVTQPTLTDGGKSFVWARTNIGSATGNRFVKYTLRTSKLSYAQGSSLFNSTAWVSNHFGAITSTASSAGDCDLTPTRKACEVAITGALTFGVKP